MNSLPKTVTRQRRDCDLNPGPSAPESSTLTTRPPSHPCWTNPMLARPAVPLATLRRDLVQTEPVVFRVQFGYIAVEKRCSLSKYASPRLWNQLSAFLRQLRTNRSSSDSPNPTSSTSHIGSIDSPLFIMHHPSLFLSRLKSFLFCKSRPP